VFRALAGGPFRVPRFLRLILPLAAALALCPVAGAAFEEADAVRAAAWAPVVDGNTHEAHRQAVQSAFRQAITQVITEAGGSTARRGGGSLIDDPERYIRAYSVGSQSRGDLYYHLTLLVWVDRTLLLTEASPRP
jgi:hypothetical protein